MGLFCDQLCPRFAYVSDLRQWRVGCFTEQSRKLQEVAPSFRTRKWDSKSRGVHPLPRGFGSLLRHRTSLNPGEHFPRLSFGWAIATVRRHERVSNAPEERRVRIAPSFAHAIRRTLIALAVEIVAAGGFAILGRPTLARLYAQHDIARFAPSEGHGLGQFRPCAGAGSADLQEIGSTA